MAGFLCLFISSLGGIVKAFFCVYFRSHWHIQLRLGVGAIGAGAGPGAKLEWGRRKAGFGRYEAIQVGRGCAGIVTSNLYSRNNNDQQEGIRIE